MIEQAYGFRQLIDNYSMTQEEIARKVSLSQSAVANKLRLLRLSYEEQRKIIEYELTERHARALLRIKDAKNRLEIIEHVHKHKLNVLETERYIERYEAALLSDAKSAELPSHICFDTKRVANEVIGAINKKLESFKKAGNDANIAFRVADDGVEVVVWISNLKRNNGPMAHVKEAECSYLPECFT